MAAVVSGVVRVLTICWKMMVGMTVEYWTVKGFFQNQQTNQTGRLLAFTVQFPVTVFS